MKEILCGEQWLKTGNPFKEISMISNLIEHLNFILPAIGKNESRKNIMWAKCEVANEYIYIIAADGYMIKTAKFYIGERIEDQTFYIDRESISSLINIYADLKNDNEIYDMLEISNDDPTVHIFSDHFQVENIIINFEPYECEYPDLSSIIDAHEIIKPDEYCVNTCLLLRAVNGSKTDSNIKIEIVKHISPKLSPIIRIDFLDNEHMAYLMPAIFKY
jgi:hypothetical protein